MIFCVKIGEFPFSRGVSASFSFGEPFQKHEPGRRDRSEPLEEGKEKEGLLSKRRSLSFSHESLFTQEHPLRKKEEVFKEKKMHAWKKDKFTRSRRKRKGKGPVSHENASMGLKCMHEKPSFISEFLISVFMRQSEVGKRAGPRKCKLAAPSTLGVGCAPPFGRF